MQRPVTQTHTSTLHTSLADRFYIALFSALKQTCCTPVTHNSEWVTVAFPSAFLKHSLKWCPNSTIWFLHGWCHVHHIPCTSVQCHFNWSHTCRVHVSLAVICRLHFWQNNQDLLCATAVTRGWSSCQNKSECRKLTLEQKILSPFLLGLKPTTFWSQVWHSTTQLFPPTPNHHPLCPVQSTVTRNNFQGIYSIKVVYEHIYQIK